MITIRVIGVTGPDGRVYSIPSFWSVGGEGTVGQVLSNEASTRLAERIGWDKFPVHDSPQEHNRAAKERHRLIEQDAVKVGIPSFEEGGSIADVELTASNIPLQRIQERLGIGDPQTLWKFSEQVREIESGGGNRSNPESSARGYYQWLTDNPDPTWLKGNSFQTALNRMKSVYNKMDAPLPDWYDKARAASLDENAANKFILDDMTMEQERELFFANIGEQTGSDELLQKAQQGDIDAMKELYSRYHHTNVDDATRGRIEDIFNI